MKTQLEIGDKIQRFEISLTREIEYIYEIKSVTKTLAKDDDGHTIFKRELNFNSTKPVGKHEYVAQVFLKDNIDYSKQYFLIK